MTSGEKLESLCERLILQRNTSIGNWSKQFLLEDLFKHTEFLRDTNKIESS